MAEILGRSNVSEIQSSALHRVSLSIERGLGNREGTIVRIGLLPPFAHLRNVIQRVASEGPSQIKISGHKSAGRQCLDWDSLGDHPDTPLAQGDQANDEGQEYTYLTEILRLLHVLKELNPDKYREFMRHLKAWAEETGAGNPEQAIDIFQEADDENGDEEAPGGT